MTKIITIASGKGGVGKTTITSNLGVALAYFGKDVTLLDADIKMANLEIVFGMEGKSITLNDVLSGNADIKEAIYEGPEGIKVVPAGLSLEKLRKANIEHLQQVIGPLLKQTDIILIDAPAGLDKDALAAIDVSQDLILVTTPEITSISDVLKTKYVAQRLGVNILGVVINRNKNDNELLSYREIKAILKVPILGIIPEDIEFSRSTLYSKPLLLEKSNSSTYNSLMQTAANIIDIDYIPATTDRKGLISRLLDGIMGKKDDLVIES